MQLLQDSGAGFFAAFAMIWLLFFLVGIAITILAIVATVQAYRANREGWWVYLILIFVFPLAGVIMWFFFGKKNPIMSGGRPFM